MSTTIIDQDARSKAVERLDLSMAYSAGAGAGKTTVLVARVVAMLRQGVSPDRIAVVTFTKKATQELQERIRDQVEEEFQRADGEERERLAAVLRDISELTISTIHSFCQQLLHAEALDAGWSPSTELLAASLAPSASDEAYDAWRRSFRERHTAEARRIWNLETDRSIKKAAAAILENRDLEPVIGEQSPQFETAAAELRPLLAHVETLATRCLNPDSCKLYRGNDEVVRLGHEARDLDAESLVLRGLTVRTDLRGGTKKDWPGDSKQEFCDLLKELRAFAERWKNIEYEPLHRLIIEDLRAEFLPAALALKSLRGQADFQDLLFGARELLANVPAARRRLVERFTAILVDEVQDTDPVQSEVVALLGRDPSAEGKWNEHPVRAGSIFAVGDYKQSIYRFRRADPEQWRLLSELIGRNGAEESLVQNFRSTPGIVSWVNHVFGSMPGFEALVAHRTDAALDPVVAIHDDEGDDADAVARYLLHLQKSGAMVHDGGSLRPMRWRDVMLLVPAWTNAEELQNKLLRAQIPCVVEGGKEFFKRDEVRIALAALRAVDEPADSEAIVFALRGLFGISLDELAEHLQNGGSWRYTLPEQPQGPATEALEVLRAMHRKRGESSWLSILDELLEHTRAAAVWSLTARGSAIPANLDKFRISLRQCEEAARSSSETIHLLAKLADSADEEDLSTIDVDSDEVSIMTHYGAKGLEAPIVVLPFANRAIIGSSAVVDRENGRIAIPVGKHLKPPGWDLWSERDKEEDAAERQRWMYVATTRARDQLVLIVNGAKKNYKANLITAYLSDGLPSAENAGHGQVAEVAPGINVRSYRREELPEVSYETSSFPGFDPDVDAFLSAPVATPDAELESWSRERLAAVHRSKKAATRWKSVTELARKTRGKRVTADQVNTGVVVHRVMEQLDLHRAPEDLMAEVPDYLAGYADDVDLSQAYRDKALDIVEKLLRHPAVVRARSASEHWKEVPFAFADRGQVVAGTIDFCYPLDPERKRWCVVDWKVELPAPGDPKRENYERQLGLYAKAIIKNLAGVEPEIERHLVGPHPELGELDDGLDADLANVHVELQEPLAELLDAGLPIPRVGYDLGDPIVAIGELVWEDRMLTVTLDLPEEDLVQVRAAGYRVVNFDTTGPVWVDACMARLTELFELGRDPAESADSTPGDGEDGDNDDE